MSTPNSMALQLVPSSAAQFPGSFASELRQDQRRYSKSRDWGSILHAFFLDGWEDVSIWKSAFIELVGSTCIYYMSAMISATIQNLNTPQVAGYVGLSTVLIIMIFIYALAPASGGHVNPMITIATVFTGLTSLSRGALYIIAQTIGAALAGGLIRGSLGDELTQLYHGGGCYLDSKLISQRQAYMIESMLCFCAVFLAFGVGLDPRQAQVFGPRLGPMLVGIVVGLVTFSSVGIAAGYPGAGLNPGRCFAAAIARGDLKDQWIWWTGPLTGSLIQSAVYYVAPPYHRQMAQERATLHALPQLQDSSTSKV